MRLPVDTTVTRFVSAGPSEPVIDFDSKAQKLDPNGVAVNQVHLFVVGDGGTREVITVQKECFLRSDVTVRFALSLTSIENKRENQPTDKVKQVGVDMQVRNASRENDVRNMRLGKGFTPVRIII